MRGVLLGVRRRERGQVSQKDHLGAGKGREAATWVTSMGGGHDEEERDLGNQAGGTLSLAVSRIHHNSFRGTRNKAV